MTTMILPKVYALTHSQAVTNIVATFRRATPEQRAAGASWYDEAHALARALDPFNVQRAAGVIAALSPRMPWEQNVTLAVRAYADGQASGAPFADMATRILRGEPVTQVLRGPKTRAFALTIADPAHATTVVVDRHALSIILGRQSTDADAKALARKGAYDACARAYVAAAEILGMSATVVQATTWVVWRATALRERGVAA